MRAGIAALVGAYVLSQFYRAFLAVLAPVLSAELGASAEALARASGLWFLAFAGMQIPIGEMLDRIGPRRTAFGLMLAGVAGAVLFATAQGPGQVQLAMVLIGVGCSPVLMAAYFIFARQFSAAAFGTLAGLTIGVGSVGNLAASLPLSAAVEAFGWRATVWGLAAVTLISAVSVLALVRDPPRVPAARGGSVLTLLAMPHLWPVLILMAICYAPPAGLRGLWVGPYYTDVFAATTAQIGTATLVMGLAMVAGNFAYGPLERLFGTRKWLNFGGNMGMAAAIGVLWLWPEAGGAVTLAALAAAGFFGASFPMVMAHGRAFLPPHLVGRGVTLINLFGIGSTGILQFATGRIHAATPATPASAPYEAVFLFYLVLAVVGLAVYAFSQDRTD